MSRKGREEPIVKQSSVTMFRLWLVLLTVCWGARPVQSDCGPVEEGQSTTLTCDVSTASCPASSIVLRWYAETFESSPVINCFNGACGGGLEDQRISATISPTRSTLTISAVSRTDPINMETKWECEPCTGSADRVTACEKLQIYALPESPGCTPIEVPVSGDIQSVTLSCSTSRVYPRAQCRFYNSRNGGLVEINETPSYNHPETGGSPVYYRSECSVSVPVGDLGEGTHSFTGYIYPDVTGGEQLVSGTQFDKTVTLEFPQASHSCSTNMVAGFFQGRFARCNCSLTSDGNPRGTARWYRGDDVQTVGSDDALLIFYDSDNPDQTFTCEAYSALGRRVGSTLTANFAYICESRFWYEPFPWRGDDFHTETPTWSEGVNVTFTCRGCGNPEPTLTLKKKNTGEVLTRPQAAEVIHTMDPLSCMDTSVYTCSSENIRGKISQDVSINVQCPQQVVPSLRALPVVQANSAQIEIEIYGFPTPSVLTLAKRNEGTDLTGSPRHAVRYIPGVNPFGRVIVTILELVKADFASYTLTVDNSVGEAMVYDFTLEDEGETDDDVDYFSVAAVIVAVIALVINIVLVVIIVYLLRRSRSELTQRPGSRQAPPSGPALHYRADGEYLAPLETPASSGRLHAGPDKILHTTLPAPASYDTTSPQDWESPNIYSHPMPDVSPVGTSRSSGTYNNMPGRTADDSVNVSSGGSGKPGLAGDYANA